MWKKIQTIIIALSFYFYLLILVLSSSMICWMCQWSGLKLPPKKIWLYPAVGRLPVSRIKGKPQNSPGRFCSQRKSSDEQWLFVLDGASCIICGIQCKMGGGVWGGGKGGVKPFFFLPLSLSTCHAVLAWAAITKYLRLGGLDNRNLFSHSFRSWEIQDQGAGPDLAPGETSSWFADSGLLAISSQCEERKSSNFSSFYGVSNHTWALPSRPHPNLVISQRRRLQISSPWELGLQPINFVETWTFSP